MRPRRTRRRQQAVLNSVQAFPRGFGQRRIGPDNLANHLPRRQIERSLRSRAHRQRHRTLRTETDALRSRFLTRPHSGRLREHEHGHGFLSGLKFPVTAKAIQMIHVRPRSAKTSSRYFLQRVTRGTSMQKDSRTRADHANQLCSSQTTLASSTLFPMGAGSAARVSRSKTPRQQVAAVCYRIRGSHVEFLLVQTSGGRWIFPKGGVEPGRTHAESAALEAFEEAGVHGRIEKIPFTRYYRKPVQTSAEEPAVSVHLCEVSRLERPQESHRRPSWFSADKAKQRLRKDRAPELGAELLRVVDKAAARIHRLHSASPATSHAPVDGLRKVRFEANEDGRFYDGLRQAALARYFLSRPQLRLGDGEATSAEAVVKITTIDSKRRTQKS
jgi:8-oxo-dGTP pyrophosphatase MutT (NUDIX family)